MLTTVSEGMDAHLDWVSRRSCASRFDLTKFRELLSGPAFQRPVTHSAFIHSERNGGAICGYPFILVPTFVWASNALIIREKLVSSKACVHRLTPSTSNPAAAFVNGPGQILNNALNL